MYSFEMSGEIFLLSVFEKFAAMIREGRKKWEFRENPAFGRDGGHVLKPGDAVFIVASCDRPYLSCVAMVHEIIRGEEIGKRFEEVAAGQWLESGAPSVDYFRKEILGRYQVALLLEAAPIDPVMDVDRIVRSGTGRSWSGRGFYHVSSLKRFQIDGRNVEEVLGEMLARSFPGAGTTAGRKTEAS